MTESNSWLGAQQGRGKNGIWECCRVFVPSLPWDKIKILLEFWEAKKSGNSYLLCSEGEKLRGSSRRSQLLLYHKIPEKKKGIVALGLLQGSKPSPENLFPTQKNSNKCSSSSLSKISLKKTPNFSV